MLDWDVERWLPFDSAASNITALDGQDCWRAVFTNRLFIKFVTAILLEPADIIVLRLRPSTSASFYRLCCAEFGCLVGCDLRALCLPRLRSRHGVHRGPTVGLVVSRVLAHQRIVSDCAFFPLSLGASRMSTSWIGEVDRLCEFLSCGTSV